MPEIYASAVVPAPIDEVWSELRDFERAVEVFDYVDEVFIEDGEPPDRVGAVKHGKLTEEAVSDNPYLPPDNAVRETLVALDDDEHYFKYDFTETHYPVRNYLGKLECTPITASDRTLVEWSATFDAEPGKAAEAGRIVEKQTAFFEEGLAEYVRLFE